MKDTMLLTLIIAAGGILCGIAALAFFAWLENRAYRKTSQILNAKEVEDKLKEMQIKKSKSGGII